MRSTRRSNAAAASRRNGPGGPGSARASSRLTAREREVFEHVVRGMLNKQIAAELGASEKTIKVHRARVMQKMQADSLADLVRMAERVGIPRSDG